jgi:hypothetical protein
MDLKKLALACGSVGGVEITEEDVRNALRAKTYSRLVGRDGLLPPGEMARLKKAVRHAVAQRLVDEEIVKATQQRGAKPIVAKSNPAWFRSQRQDTLIDEALRTKRTMVPMAKFLEPSYQQQQKQLAWAEFNRGPMWLRSNHAV